MALLQALPSHLVGQILDGLESKERARLAIVSKTWRTASETHLRAVKLSFTSLRELEQLRAWLGSLAGRGMSVGVQEFELFWRGGKIVVPDRKL